MHGYTDVSPLRKTTGNWMAVNKQTLEALDLFSNIPIGISSVILIIHVVAPLFGGVFLSKALVIHGGNIAFWFCIKYFLNRQNK
jgi:hypothetical protein